MINVEKAVAEIIVQCNQIIASLATPQYGFKEGLQIFGNKRYNSTVKELKNNLIGRGCIKMLKKARSVRRGKN